MQGWRKHPHQQEVDHEDEEWREAALREMQTTGDVFALTLPEPPKSTTREIKILALAAVLVSIILLIAFHVQSKPKVAVAASTPNTAAAAMTTTTTTTTTSPSTQTARRSLAADARTSPPSMPAPKRPVTPTGGRKSVVVKTRARHDH